MALGNSRPRNWGKEAQQVALDIVLKQGNVAYKVEKNLLYLAPSKGDITLPFESVAMLENVRRGRWKSYSYISGRELATGVSERDVIRATIQAVWQ